MAAVLSAVPSGRAPVSRMLIWNPAAQTRPAGAASRPAAKARENKSRRGQTGSRTGQEKCMGRRNPAKVARQLNLEENPGQCRPCFPRKPELAIIAPCPRKKGYIPTSGKLRDASV